MKKKILKITGIILVLIIGTLVALPFLLESKIGDLVKNNVNNNVNAHLDFTNAKLSLIRSFPQVEVRLTGVTLINKAPFEGDTLFATDHLELKMGIGELFKDPSETIAIKTILIDGGQLNITVDKDGLASYDIGKDTDSEGEGSNEGDGFELHLQSYAIEDFDIRYHDSGSETLLVLEEVQHHGTGDLSLQRSELQTSTSAKVSFEMGGTGYLKENQIQLEALIDMDFEQHTYSFLENKAVINQLPLVFEGHIKVNEEDQELDIKFKAPSSDFKNFLGLVPEQYSKSLEGVETTGECTVEGSIKGVVDEEHIPRFSIQIASSNASFKYPDLPRTVEQIDLEMALINTTGISEDTFIDVKNASFNIAGDQFNLTSRIKALMGNVEVFAKLKGILNLKNLSQAYPMPEDMGLSGILNADVTTAFDMASIEDDRYENTTTSGALKLDGFEYRDPDMKNPIHLERTALTFSPNTVTLEELQGSTGSSDFKAIGTLDNFLGFVFNNEKVMGEFELDSNHFNINDFMTEEQGVEQDGGEAVEEQLKIPSYLDCNIVSTARTVHYDNMILKEVSGNIRIADEKVSLSNMNSTLFNGKVSFNGEVSTKNDVPTFNMSLGMDQLGIGESFKSLELFKALAPVAAALRGTLNSDIQLSGKLNNDFTPNLRSVSGNVLAELLSAELNADQAKIISSLGQHLDFIKTDKLDLKGLKTALSFEDGVVKVKPFTIAYDDIHIKVEGSHTFDRQLNYKATMDVPTRYLGADINSLIAKIDDSQLETMTLPVTANIGGGYASPEVSTDLTSGVKELSSKLVQIQKDKLLNKGKESVGNLLESIVSGDSPSNDSVPAKENPSNETVKEVIGDLLGGGSDKEEATGAQADSTLQNNEDPIKEKAKNILGGLLGGKKKKDSTDAVKDSVN